LRQVEEANKSQDHFFSSLNDYHFLCWIGKKLDEEGYHGLRDKIINGAKGEAEDALITGKQLSEFIQRHIQVPVPTPPQSPRFLQEAALPEGVSPESLSILTAQNFSYEISVQALAIWDGNVEAAINWILDQEGFA